ncbi:unnamed protein product, partial [Ectocarpus fasciculatus]
MSESNPAEDESCALNDRPTSAFSGDKEPCSGERVCSPTSSCLWFGVPSGTKASCSFSSSSPVCGCCGTKTGGVERAGTATSSSWWSTLSVGCFISCVGRIRALHEPSP